jgi:phosphoribosylformimino-5-aminoimidazole carboxamide ribotide isomerase
MPQTPGVGQPRTFDLLPAIDLRSGRVVRLREGDFDRETAYTDDPVERARRFLTAGASWIHVVDLDGARGERRQTDLVKAVVDAAAPARCQVAGGLRDRAAVAAILAAGAARVVVGTAALADPRFAGDLVGIHGAERIVGALDVRDGLAVGEGWREGAPAKPLLDALSILGDAGVTRFAVTAIDRDGLLAGPDLGLLEQAVGAGRGAIIASGGISSLDDLRTVRDLGCSGAIVGRALYEGRLDLGAAVAAFAVDS